jgi:hypothetical protein
VKRMLRVLAAIVAALVGLTVNVYSARAVATEQLPDLRMSKLSSFYIERASNGEKRLRFTTVIVNAGPGRFELRGKRPDTSTARMNISQRIYNTSGTYRSIDIPRSSTHMFYAGDGHNHWHVYRLQRFEIRRLDAAGSVAELKGTGAKTGFCFFDNTKYNLTLPGARQTPYYTNCGISQSLNVKMGLSVGWGDKYGATLAYQWIKINGLRDGNYRVRVIADPYNWFLETNDHNNYTWANIRLSGGGTSVTVLRSAH